MADLKKLPRKSRKSKILGVPSREFNKSNTFPQRVFLYLHLKSISYPQESEPSDKSEIEVTHHNNKITTLSDHYIPRNIIKVNQLNNDNPTFSITIEQDSLEDLTILGDTPILLTLYEYIINISDTNNASKGNDMDEEVVEEVRVPISQGHIDILEFFNNKRVRSIETIFMYPLSSQGNNLTCKTEWDIYSLHPLLKTVDISNFIFINFGSLYNVSQDLLDNYQNLALKLSFISKNPNEKNEYDKIYICNYKSFSKSLICNQIQTISWESLKSDEFENMSCMGIAFAVKYQIDQLFFNVLSTNNVELNFNQINVHEDFAITGNSMHRYVLTNDMKQILEDVLTRDLYQLIVEVYSRQNESNILLKGYIDLSVFMYPDVNSCPFAVELRPPENKSTTRRISKGTAKSKKTKKNSKDLTYSFEQLVKNETTFATIKICLCKPLTLPSQNMAEFSNIKYLRNRFCQQTSPQTSPLSSNINCDKYYREFDDLILEILDYIVNNNIKALNDDKEFFCGQLDNISNKIVSLIAYDFNIKTPTKTNIEFTNLITKVYRDLISRTYDFLNKCSLRGLENCVFTVTKVQRFIVDNMSMAKYLTEIGNLEMADIFMNILLTEYPNKSMLKFYIFLYDIEKKNFEKAEKYLQSAADRDNEGEIFADLIQIYINYKRQLQDPERSKTTEEDLINALVDYSMKHSPKSLAAFILLYCIYKRHNYQPGMEYCRWKYENLYESTFIKIQFIPIPLWEIYMPHKIYLSSLKGQNFIKVIEKLVRLGLYDFAQWVFEEIADECTEIEAYFFLSTFKMLDNIEGDNLSIKTFPLDKLMNSIKMRATLSLVNGNLEHLQIPHRPASIKHYQDIVKLEELTDYQPFQLGVLRYAYTMLKEQHYQEASQAFLTLCNGKNNCIAAAVGRGQACYNLNQLDEAEKYFALSTEYGIYMPNTWAYLALINLKKGNNYNALECWKYANLNQDCEIDEEILNELSKIDYSNVFLFVDVPD